MHLNMSSTKMSTEQHDLEYFDVGACVTCETHRGQIIQGEIMAFDHDSKFLILKCATLNQSGGSTGKSRIELINLDFARNISDDKLINSSKSSPNMVSDINFDKITKRSREAVVKKRRSCCNTNVSVDAQRLFMSITKTIDDIEWEDDAIVVLKHVIISAPYKPVDDVVSIRPGIEQDSHAVQRAAKHVRKLVDKFWKDQQHVATETLTDVHSSLGEMTIEGQSAMSDSVSGTSAANSRSGSVSSRGRDDPNTDTGGGGSNASPRLSKANSNDRKNSSASPPLISHVNQNSHDSSSTSSSNTTATGHSSTGNRPEDNQQQQQSKVTSNVEGSANSTHTNNTSTACATSVVALEGRSGGGKANPELGTTGPV